RRAGQRGVLSLCGDRACVRFEQPATNAWRKTKRCAYRLSGECRIGVPGPLVVQLSQERLDWYPGARDVAKVDLTTSLLGPSAATNAWWRRPHRGSPRHGRL